MFEYLLQLSSIKFNRQEKKNSTGKAYVMKCYHTVDSSVLPLYKWRQNIEPNIQMNFDQ